MHMGVSVRTFLYVTEKLLQYDSLMCCNSYFLISTASVLICILLVFYSDGELVCSTYVYACDRECKWQIMDLTSEKSEGNVW